MKKVFGVLISLMMAAPAMAKVSNEEFLDKLVRSVNEQLVIINKERADEGKKLYCKQLFCYPLSCPSQGRSTLGGAICNAKSYTMDKDLLRAALSSMNGKKVENYDYLQDIANRAR